MSIHEEEALLFSQGRKDWPAMAQQERDAWRQPGSQAIADWIDARVAMTIDQMMDFYRDDG